MLAQLLFLIPSRCQTWLGLVRLARRGRRRRKFPTSLRCQTWLGLVRLARRGQRERKGGCNVRVSICGNERDRLVLESSSGADTRTKAVRVEDRSRSLLLWLLVNAWNDLSTISPCYAHNDNQPCSNAPVASVTWKPTRDSNPSFPFLLPSLLPRSLILSPLVIVVPSKCHCCAAPLH